METFKIPVWDKTSCTQLGSGLGRMWPGLGFNECVTMQASIIKELMEAWYLLVDVAKLPCSFWDLTIELE